LTGLFVARVLIAIARFLFEIWALAFEQANTARANTVRLASISAITKAFSVKWQWNFLANTNQMIAFQRVALWCLFILAVVQVALADNVCANLLANIIQCALIAIIAWFAWLWTSITHTSSWIA